MVGVRVRDDRGVKAAERGDARGEIRGIESSRHARIDEDAPATGFDDKATASRVDTAQ
jgi:hypothetical protein